MTRPPRLIATDLDGTLLRDDHTVSRYSLDVLDRARTAGIEVLAVTARSPHGIAPLMPGCGLTGRAILSNGSVVYDLAARALLSVRTLTPAEARATAAAVRAVIPDAGFAVNTAARMVSDADYAYAATATYAARRIVADRDLLWDAAERIVRVMIHSPSLGSDAMLDRVAALGVDGVAFAHSGGESMIEAGPAGLTKATALAAYCADHGIDPEDVVAFGDMPSDLAMLTWAGRGYAMANAHPAVLAGVPGRAPANEEDGVATVVEGLLG